MQKSTILYENLRIRKKQQIILKQIEIELNASQIKEEIKNTLILLQNKQL